MGGILFCFLFVCCVSALEATKERNVRTAGSSKGSKRNYWDRPIGKIVRHGEVRRYIFHLEKFDQLNFLGASMKV